MPCQYCNSSTHTLSGCHANITVFTDAIEHFMGTSSFALRQQYQYLDRLQKPILAIICNRLGFGCSHSKLKLVAIIISHYFRPLLTMDPIVIQIASEQLKAEVKEAYDSLQMWNIDDKPDMCDFRNGMFFLLEKYHLTAFGLSYSQELINGLVRRSGSDVLPFVPVFQLAVLPIIPPPPAAAVHSSKSHLKKLKIKVKLDKKLQVQECFMCCDEDKPIARLGCSHEYCMDCVVKCAKVRTKSFIVCAMCRVEVEEIHIGNKELKKSLIEQLKKE
jgi:hypothetical protein